MLIGNNNNELGVMTVLPANFLGSTSKSIRNYLAQMLNTGITCATRDAARIRAAAKVKVWRYRYFGEWPNQFLAQGAGAFYGSEIPMIFGSSEFYTRKKDIEEEIKTSRIMRKAWSEFAKNPQHGLEKMGWPVFNENSTFLLDPYHLTLHPIE
jgi:carboxylesterase type B